MISKEEMKAAVDLNDDGLVDYKDFIILGIVMLGGYFIVKAGVSYFKRGR